ncbi:PAAR-like protein [Prevotella denticola]|uniref:PAAR-like protein n=1 Tax=Prevotella denticola TaxID=28129 RepID=UPI0028ECAC65|nr:PAAR-like protein [Prevotella denticola]
MGQSYIREGTNVVCTNMTCGTPQFLLRGAQDGLVINKSSDNPVLNINAKKMSASFACKMATKVWGGLQSFLLGVAVGAAAVFLVAATITTCGAALPAIVGAVAITSETVALASIAVGGLAAGYAEHRKQKGLEHDCDITMESKWANPNDYVFIEKEKALLNRSQMRCNIGGTINIILDPEVAKVAAKYISKMNSLEIQEQKDNKFLQGIVSGLTGGATPIALAISVGLYTGALDFLNFWNDDSLGETRTSNNEDPPSGNSVKNTAGTNVYSSGAGGGADNAISTGVNAHKAGVKKGAEIDSQISSKTAEASKQGEKAVQSKLGEMEMRDAAEKWGKEASRRASNGASTSSVESAKTVEGICERTSEEYGKQSAQAVKNQTGALAEKTTLEEGKDAAVKAAKRGAWKEGAKKFGMALGVGLAGGVVNYFMEDNGNDNEQAIENKVGRFSKELNLHEENNEENNEEYMGIISNS